LRIIGIITKWLFILCLPLLLLTASLALAVNSAWLYEYGFDKYNVGQTTGLDWPELEKASTGLVHYFNSGEENISLSVVKDGEPFVLFNQREVAHLRDVKGLIWLDYWILLGTLIYALGYAGVSLWRKNRRQLSWGLVGGSGLTLALMLALGLGALFNFERLFLQFHLISFANELWLLDPSKDYLIMLFPQGFWFDATLFCTGVAWAGALILGGVGVGVIYASTSSTSSSSDRRGL